MSKFYRSRPKPPDAPTGESYFNRADPDGVVRDLTSEAERRQKAADCYDETEELSEWHIQTGPIVDVGCGVGTLLRELRGRGRIVFGVEPDPVAAKAAMLYANVPVFGSTRDIHDDVAEGVLCYHVIEHVPEPEPFVLELHRILEPGGRLVISTPDFESPVARVWGENYRMLHDPTHVSLFSTAGLVGLLEESGFTIERVWHPWPKRYRTPEQVLRLLDDPTKTVSPPAPGNHVSVVAVKA